LQMSEKNVLFRDDKSIQLALQCWQSWQDEVTERTIEEEMETVHCLESDKQITQQPESGESNGVPQEIAEEESNPIIDEPQMENDDREQIISP
jgi:hypothetical protein